MWQRLKDLQQEAENRRWLEPRSLPSLVGLAGLLARRAWHLAGLAMQRPPRPSPLRLPRSGRQAARPRGLGGEPLQD